MLRLTNRIGAYTHHEGARSSDGADSAHASLSEVRTRRGVEKRRGTILRDGDGDGAAALPRGDVAAHWSSSGSHGGWRGCWCPCAWCCCRGLPLRRLPLALAPLLPLRLPLRLRLRRRHREGRWCCCCCRRSTAQPRGLNGGERAYIVRAHAAARAAILYNANEELAWSHGIGANDAERRPSREANTAAVNAVCSEDVDGEHPTRRTPSRRFAHPNTAREQRRCRVVVEPRRRRDHALCWLLLLLRREPRAKHAQLSHGGGALRFAARNLATDRSALRRHGRHRAAH